MSANSIKSHGYLPRPDPSVASSHKRKLHSLKQGNSRKARHSSSANFAQFPCQSYLSWVYAHIKGLPHLTPTDSKPAFSHKQKRLVYIPSSNSQHEITLLHTSTGHDFSSTNTTIIISCPATEEIENQTQVCVHDCIQTCRLYSEAQMFYRFSSS